jgi:hypothetical protein
MSKERRDSLNKFRVGGHGGCEAILYEFSESEGDELDPSNPMRPIRRNVIRIAARTFDEAFEYLRWRQPKFVIDRVESRGLIFPVSGSPMD